MLMAKAAGGVALGGSRPSGETGTVSPLPRRPLGRTKVDVPVLGLGFGPLGLGGFSSAELEAVAEAAVAEGVTYFDVQWDYGEAERFLAPVVKAHRPSLFLCAKTPEQPRLKAFASIRDSVRRMGAGYLDAALLNNIGDFDLDSMAAADGVLEGLKQAQREGLVRFLGICGHMRAGHFVRALETGEFDIVMAPVNFVDRHTYEFETKALAAAAKCGVGVVAMKVLGGAYKYDTRRQRARLGGADYELAIRYALTVPGVATAVVGCKSVREVRRAAALARGLRPLGPDESRALAARGTHLAAQWGEHLGPV